MVPIHRSRQIQELFEDALDVSEPQRASYLAGACADSALRAQVEELLEQDSETGHFLEAPLQRGPCRLSGLSAPRAGSPQRERIGRYQVLGRIGSGGQSTVYLARRSDRPWQQRVAIKVAHSDHGFSDHRSCFEKEARILASLEHPSIARLLDSGATGDGKGYLVMEYVPGEAITDACDRRSASLEQRLQLFRRVCAAVHYAHQNLVVHRDLKPSNILVTSGGAPKLLDFGIAKLLEPVADDQLTRTEQLVATAAYASPEQLSGQRITTASDVYSLGVLLHELLTGFRPYATRGLAPGAILEMLRRESLARPSAAFARHSDVEGRRASARRRQTTAEGLAKRLRGDLDTILAKALAVEVGDRYASVAQLDEDLRRHLEGLPLLTGAPSARAVLAKLARRHPRRTTLALSSFVFLVVLLVAGTWQSYRMAEEREIARAALGPDSSKTASVLVNLATLEDVMGNEEAAIELYGQLLDSELRPKRALRNLGLIDLRGAHFEQAEQHLAVAREMRATLDPSRPEWIMSEVDWALLERARGKPQQAEAVLDGVLGRSVSNSGNLVITIDGGCRVFIKP